MSTLDSILEGEYEYDEGYEIDPQILRDFESIKANFYGQLPETFFNQRSSDWVSERKKLREKFNGCLGRRKNIFTLNQEDNAIMTQINDGISRYDELKCLLLYEWFNDKKGSVIDPFAGGCTRGVVANMHGAEYVGIDIRQEQIDANYEQYQEDSCTWICGDSRNLKELVQGAKFQHCQTSPPFPFVEHYSELEGDLSNLRPHLSYFQNAYKKIFMQVYDVLERGSLCVVDIGDGRNSQGYYYLFPEWQALMMEEIGFRCINKIASITQPYGTRSLNLMRRFVEVKDDKKKKLFNTLCMVYVYIKE